MSYSLARATRKCSPLWRSFPEILVVQVSRLVRKLEESQEDTKSTIRKQFREKIAALSQSQLPRATDALALILNGMVGPLDLPTLEPNLPGFTKPAPFVNWYRVKLAFLRSIPTGTFIDVQFFAYNTVGNNLPVDPRPLYASSIAIERWGVSITTRKSESSKFAQL